MHGRRVRSLLQPGMQRVRGQRQAVHHALKGPANAESRPTLKPEASDAVRGEWARRIGAEYRSAAITQHLTLWLIQMGASPDLIDSGLRIVKDELAHARLSHRVYTAAKGRAM